MKHVRPYPIFESEPELSSQQPDLIMWIETDSTIPVEELEHVLQTTRSWRVTNAAILHPNATPELLTRVWKQVSPNNYDVHWALAKSSVTPTWILQELAKSPEISIRNPVAENPNTPAETLSELAQDDNNWVRKRVAGNPKVPRDLLDELSRDPSTEVRTRVASNPRTPAEVLARMGREDQYYVVISEVIGNPNTPVETLIELAQSPDSRVRKLALASPRLPEDIGGWALGLDDWS